MQRARPAPARYDAAAQLVLICTPFFTPSRRIYWRVMGVHELTTYLREHKRTLAVYSLLRDPEHLHPWLWMVGRTPPHSDHA